MTIGIVWFRQDLRLRDNRALSEACRVCDEVLCVFIDDPLNQTVSRLGEASRVWLHHALSSLQQSLCGKGSELYLEQGESQAVLTALMRRSGATRVFWNRCYDPLTIERDRQIKSALADYKPRTFNSLLLHEPWEVLKADGSPYRVFTPYWRAAATAIDREPERLACVSMPRRIPPLSEATAKRLGSPHDLKQLGLLPAVNWHASMMQPWAVGEAAALTQLKRFLATAVHDYETARNRPADGGTSCLSPHLHVGEISPRQALVRVLAGRSMSALTESEVCFAKELVWREFAYALLYHYPQTVDEPLDRRFVRFPWQPSYKLTLRRWQQGRTGVPIVDAGMRELYATGWMHNRVRMIVASYLVKNLLIPWQEGERWFRDTLVDADLASNSMGWQWSAGCGVDAAPFFRIFNPVLQGEKFDREGDYVKQWVPELASLGRQFIHKPWELNEDLRADIDYPPPLVDLRASRQRALEAFSAIKGTISH